MNFTWRPERKDEGINPDFKNDYADSKLTNKLIKQYANAQRKYLDLKEKIDKGFLQRYGVHYSGIECDSLIDAFDYSGVSENVTVAYCDMRMAQFSGVKPL